MNYFLITLLFVSAFVKILNKTSNKDNLTHTTPGEIGILLFSELFCGSGTVLEFQPNVSWRLGSAIKVPVTWGGGPRRDRTEEATQLRLVPKKRRIETENIKGVY